MEKDGQDIPGKRSCPLELSCALTPWGPEGGPAAKDTAPGALPASPGTSQASVPERHFHGAELSRSIWLLRAFPTSELFIH